MKQRHVPSVQKVQKVVQQQRHVPSIQKVQKTVEVPQVQYIDRVVDVPVVKQRQVPSVQKIQKTVGSTSPIHRSCCRCACGEAAPGSIGPEDPKNRGFHKSNTSIVLSMCLW